MILWYNDINQKELVFINILKKFISSNLAFLTAFACFQTPSYAAPVKKEEKSTKTSEKVAGFACVGLSALLIAAIIYDIVNDDEEISYASEFCGIPNYGNSCFMNSALQLLYQIPEIRNMNPESLQNVNDNFLSSINTIMKKLKNRQKVSKDEIKKLYASLGLNFGIQHSACADVILSDQFGALRNILKRSSIYADDYNDCIDKNDDILTKLNNNGINNYANGYTNLFINIDRFKYESNGEPEPLVTTGDTLVPETLNVNGENFELKSAIYYSGNGRFGHYINFSKDSSGNWYLCNDGKIIKIDHKLSNEEKINYQKFYPTGLLYTKSNSN